MYELWNFLPTEETREKNARKNLFQRAQNCVCDRRPWNFGFRNKKLFEFLMGHHFLSIVFATESVFFHSNNMCVHGFLRSVNKKVCKDFERNFDAR